MSSERDEPGGKNQNVEKCPECGSGAVSEKGMTIDGTGYYWNDCRNCGWDDK